MKENTVNSRIMQVINEYGFNKNSFSRHIGLDNNTTVGGIVAGKQNKPSWSVLQKIITAFPDLSVNWLVSGKGEMRAGKRSLFNNIHKRIDKSLKDIKEKYGITVDEIILKLDTNKDTYIGWLDGIEPSVDLIYKLGTVFSVDLDYIFYGSNEPRIKAVQEPQEPYGKCGDCVDKDQRIIKLQTKLIECMEGGEEDGK